MKLPKGFVPDAEPQGMPLDGFVADDEAAPEDDSDEPPAFLTPGNKRQPAMPIRNTGPISKVRAELDPRNAEGHGVFDQAAGAVNSAVDKYSMGAFGGLMRLAHGLNNTDVGRRVNSVIAPEVNEGGGSADAALSSMDEYHSRHPGLNMITDAPAYMLNGPVTAVAASVDRLLPQVATHAGRIARGTLSAAGTGAVTAGSEAALHGEAPEDVAAAVGQGAMGGTLAGAGAGVAGAALGAAGRAVLGSRGGQARTYLNEQHAPVSPPQRSFGQPEPMTYDPATPIATGDLAGMPAGEAIAMLEKQIPHIPASARPAFLEEIASIKAGASTKPVVDPEVARAQDELKFKLPGSHGLGAMGGAAALLHLGGHTHLTPLAGAILAAKNASPIAGRVLYGPAQMTQGLGILQRPDLLQAARRTQEEEPRP